MHLPKIVEMIALAAQRYGIIVRDQSHAAIGFFAEDPTQYGDKPYTASDPYYGVMRDCRLARWIQSAAVLIPTLCSTGCGPRLLSILSLALAAGPEDVAAPHTLTPRLRPSQRRGYTPPRAKTGRVRGLFLSTLPSSACSKSSHGGWRWTSISSPMRVTSGGTAVSRRSRTVISGGSLSGAIASPESRSCPPAAAPEARPLRRGHQEPQRPAHAAVALRRRAPAAACRSCCGRACGFTPRRTFHRLSRPVTEALYRDVPAIVVYGEHVKRVLLDVPGVSSEKIFVAGQAVDASRFESRAAGRATAGPWCCSSASLRSARASTTCWRRSTKSTDHDAELRLVGNGSLEEQIRRRINGSARA